MHEWGDDWFEKNGNDLNKAIDRIQTICSRGRIGMWGKEKYGTFRDELRGLWDGSIYSMVYPGYAWIKFPKWFYFQIDYPIIRKISKYTGVRALVQYLQSQVYNYAIQSTVKLYPHLEKELTVMLDGIHMVRPGLFGSLDGKKIYEANWN